MFNFSVLLVGQTVKTILGSFIDSSKVFNYEFKQYSNDLYSFKICPLEKQALDSCIDDKNELVFNEFSQQKFVYQFCVLLNKCKDGFDSVRREDESLASGIFYSIKMQLDFNEDEPITAYVKLNKSEIHSSREIKPRKQWFWSKFNLAKYEKQYELLTVDNIQIEFEDGTIKNIVVDLYPLDSNGYKSSKRFMNTTPISVSTLNDPNLFRNIYLSREDTCEGDDSTDNECIYYILLSDLIDYVNLLETNKEDYSPVNCVVTLDKYHPIQSLRKERRSDLLMVKVFSDLYGLQGNEPNGLLQMEASRKINLNTNRRKINNHITRGNMGIFSYVEPKFLFSRIEDNQNHLYLSLSDINHSSLNFGLSSVDILRYQNSAFDLDVNLFRAAVPQIKSTFQANLLGGITRLIVTDSIELVAEVPMLSNSINTNDLSTLKYGFSALLDIKPDSRYGINIRGDILAVNPLDINYFIRDELVNTSLSSEYFMPTLLSISVDAFLELSKRNSVFFRYKISGNLVSFRDEPFIQVQVGYQADLVRVTK
jgi:hypothetical protein